MEIASYISFLFSLLRQPCEYFIRQGRAIALMMGAVSTSETSVNYGVTTQKTVTFILAAVRILNPTPLGKIHYSFP
jgi:hypothetical protein